MYCLEERQVVLASQNLVSGMPKKYLGQALVHSIHSLSLK